MAKGGCVDGQLVDASFVAPIPLIGLYIATATSVCLIFMTYDFLHGLIQKKHFLPCKWFKLNALTLTLLQVATKIPVDLTASMPRAEDQLSKLTGTALLCTALGFFMPSLGTMGIFERYSNMVALSMTVITVIVNVFIQMLTGPIFAFEIEHIIIIICMFVLLLLMWSSGIAFRGQIESSESHYESQTKRDRHYFGDKAYDVKEVNGLGELLKKLHILNYTGNPQSLLCETSHHHAIGLLCALSFIVVLQATLRSLVLKTMSFCDGADDYKWSIPLVIVTQLLTIAVGTSTIIYRWYYFVCHTDFRVLYVHEFDRFLARELEYAKLKTLSFRVRGKNLSSVLQVPKDIIMELLIHIQIMLYKCSNRFIGRPIYGVRMFFGVMHQKTKTFFGVIAAYFSSHERKVEAPHPYATDRLAVQVSQDHVISSVGGCKIFNNWIIGVARKDYERWTKKYDERSYQTLENLIHCIPKGPASKSECIAFGRTLDRISWSHVYIYTRELNFDIEDEYKVSCLSVLVLSRILVELMPSSRGKFLEDSSKALDESFEIIYYVDQKTLGDQTRLSLTKMVWANWKNPKHWFHEIISDAFKKRTQRMNSEKSNLDDVHHARQVLKHARHAIKRYSANGVQKDRPLTGRHKLLTLKEIVILCKFILKQKHESIEDMFDFLEIYFVKMLRFTLSTLPQAILKEIEGDYPYGICEGNVREALKFFCAFKSLEEKIEWSWEREFLSETQENGIKSFVDAPDSGSEDEAEATSIGADRRDGNSRFASLAACLCCRQDVGSDGTV